MIDPSWEESDDEFEGVGAHPNNHRYDRDVDDEDAAPDA